MKQITIYKVIALHIASFMALLISTILGLYTLITSTTPTGWMEGLILLTAGIVLELITFLKGAHMIKELNNENK